MIRAQTRVCMCVSVCVLTGTPSAGSSAGRNGPDFAPTRPGSPSAESGSAPLGDGSPPPCCSSADSAAGQKMPVKKKITRSCAQNHFHMRSCLIPGTGW